MNLHDEHSKVLQKVKDRVAGREHQVKRGASGGPKSSVAEGAWRCEGRWQCAEQMDIWQCVDEVELDERRRRGDEDTED